MPINQKARMQRAFVVSVCGSRRSMPRLGTRPNQAGVTLTTWRFKGPLTAKLT
jgi:hypothetical protein